MQTLVNYKVNSFLLWWSYKRSVFCQKLTRTVTLLRTTHIETYNLLLYSIIWKDEEALLVCSIENQQVGAVCCVFSPPSLWVNMLLSILNMKVLTNLVGWRYVRKLNAGKILAIFIICLCVTRQKKKHSKGCFLKRIIIKLLI